MNILPYSFASVNPSFYGKNISDIQVIGNKRIEADAVLEKVKHKKNNPLKKELVRSDIHSLHQMGYFDEIEVRAEAISAQNILLVYKLKERPAISELKFDGNEKVDTDDIKEVIKTKEWNILDTNLLREDVGRIQKLYQDKGFFLARVRFEIETPNPQKPDEVSVTFKINDYDKVKIKNVTFLNNKVFTDAKLKSLFRETQEGSLFSFLSSTGSFKDSSFQQDLQILTLWYLDNGYVKFRYEPPVVTVSDDKRWLYISLFVEEGEQYKISNIDFSGDLLFTKEELLEDISLKPEETFRITKRNLDIQKLTEKYQDLGYAFVNVIPQMKINDEDRTIEINYQFEKGNLVYFGEINILGNTKTYDEVIRRELRVHEGELFHGTRLRVSKERVERLGFFAPQEIVFNTKPRPGRSDLVDLEITVKERPTGTITLGAGYGSQSGFFLSTNVSEINLFGRGQQVSLQGQYSTNKIDKSLNLGFTEPYTLGTQWSSGFDVYYITFNIPEKYDMRKLGFNLRFGHPITDDLSAFITYKNEGLKITQDVRELNRGEPTADEGTLSSIVWSLVRDVRNNRFETTGGSFQRASLETAGVGGDKKFIKYNLNNRFYRHVVGDLVFRNNTEVGQIFGVGDSPIPPAEKFYLGGPNNMRGFDIFSVGPKQGVEPLGGNVQFLSMFELEYPLIREAGVKLVTFYDIGNAYNHFPLFSSKETLTLRSNFGWGIRWFSPIGPLRFEFGYPLAQKPGETSPMFYFFIGPPF